MKMMLTLPESFSLGDTTQVTINGGVLGLVTWVVEDCLHVVSVAAGGERSLRQEGFAVHFHEAHGGAQKFFAVARDRGEDDYDVFGVLYPPTPEVEERQAWCRERLDQWPASGHAVERSKF
jgi:hypothetical protein